MAFFKRLDLIFERLSIPLTIATVRSPARSGSVCERSILAPWRTTTEGSQGLAEDERDEFTMAPMEPSNDMKRRNAPTKELSMRKRARSFGEGFGDESKRGNGVGFGSGNGNSKSNNGGIDKTYDNSRGGKVNTPQPAFSPLLVSSTFQASAPASIAQTTSTAGTNVPTTAVVVTSTSPAAADSQLISTAALSSSTPISSSSLVSTLSPTSVSMILLVEFVFWLILSRPSKLRYPL